MSSPTADDWTQSFPLLASLEPSARESLRALATRKTIPRGAVIFRPGDRVEQFPLVASGSIRVQRVTETGREIVLYRVVANETCVLTTASLLAADAYSVEGVAETDVVAYVLAAPQFNALLSQSPAFRALVFQGYGKRIASLLSKIEDIICARIDVRLANRLLELATHASPHASTHASTHGAPIEVTQQALADDLGTAREVIGRTLKSFERSGWVSLSRGAIELQDQAALKALALTERD
jgi:CRP/FNR family transcriptional regulator, anaerobic regulatory protein